jgi:predicted TIM-barrel fold metal-dependent hydrolase
MSDRLMIFSCDGHVGGPPEAYKDYIDPGYRKALEELSAENEEWSSHTVRGESFKREEGEGYGTFDAKRLLEEMDAEGVSGQLLLNGHSLATTPFFSIANDVYPPELRAAGAKAFHRWLVDYAAEGDGRLAPVADPGPCLDLDAAVEELNGVADAGFVGVFMPGHVQDPALPELYDRYFDPFWAACEERSLALIIHAAFGSQQGRILEAVRKMDRMRDDLRTNERLRQELAAKNPEFASLDVSSLTAHELLELGGGAPDAMTARFGATALHAGRRAFAHLMLGGAFDRFPKLKLLLIELRADWLPATLAHLDALVPTAAPWLKLKPSEYFQRNCWIAPSSPRPSEVAMRHEIGIDKFLFATDYPHPEGTWPNTFEWMRAVFRDVPDTELRQILGENASQCLALNRTSLLAAADRIGPKAVDIRDTRREVDRSLIDAFHRRSGFRNSAEQVDRTEVERWVDERPSETNFV